MTDPETTEEVAMFAFTYELHDIVWTRSTPGGGTYHTIWTGYPSRDEAQRVIDGSTDPGRIETRRWTVEARADDPLLETMRRNAVEVVGR